MIISFKKLNSHFLLLFFYCTRFLVFILQTRIKFNANGDILTPSYLVFFKATHKNQKVNQAFHHSFIKSLIHPSVSISIELEYLFYNAYHPKKKKYFLVLLYILIYCDTFNFIHNDRKKAKSAITRPKQSFVVKTKWTKWREGKIHIIPVRINVCLA